MSETLAEERARLAARIEAIDAERVAAEKRASVLAEHWEDMAPVEAQLLAYGVPVALRAELLAHVPERLRAALEAGFADRDGAR